MKLLPPDTPWPEPDEFTDCSLCDGSGWLSSDGECAACNPERRSVYCSFEDGQKKFRVITESEAESERLLGLFLFGVALPIIVALLVWGLR